MAVLTLTVHRVQRAITSFKYFHQRFLKQKILISTLRSYREWSFRKKNSIWTRFAKIFASGEAIRSYKTVFFFSKRKRNCDNVIDAEMQLRDSSSRTREEYSKRDIADKMLTREPSYCVREPAPPKFLRLRTGANLQRTLKQVSQYVCSSRLQDLGRGN